MNRCQSTAALRDAQCVWPCFLGSRLPVRLRVHDVMMVSETGGEGIEDEVRGFVGSKRYVNGQIVGVICYGDNAR